MPLSYAGIAPEDAPIRAVHVTQILDLLTGVMVDQPVLFQDGLTVNNGIAGNLTGAVTGNASTATLAASATKLATARAINGVNFDGTAAITITAASPNTLTFGTHLTGTSYNGSAPITIATDATSAATGSTIVARDSSGNFSAATITAALTGNASTATALQNARNINGTSFNGTADITVTAAAGTLTGSTLAAGVTASSLTSVGTLTGLTMGGTLTVGANTLALASATVSGTPTWSSTQTMNISGNAATATTATTSSSTSGNAATATILQTARAINGVSFNGSADITITAVAAAGTLTGTTLASGVTASSLTSVGTLTTLTISNGAGGVGKIVLSDATGNPGAHVDFLGATGALHNFQVGNQVLITDCFTIAPSTAGGGSTFTNSALALGGSGGISFSAKTGVGANTPGDTRFTVQLDGTHTMEFQVYSGGAGLDSYDRINTTYRSMVFDGTDYQFFNAGTPPTNNGMGSGSINVATNIYKNGQAVGMYLLGDLTLSGSAASIVFGSVPGSSFKHLRIIGTARSDIASIIDNLEIQFNSDGSNNYFSERLYGNSTTPAAQYNSATTGGFTAIIAGNTASVNVAGNFIIDIPYCGGSTNYHGWIASGGSPDLTGGNAFANISEGLWSGVAAITNIALFATSGNLMTGTRMSLYGYN